MDILGPSVCTLQNGVLPHNVSTFIILLVYLEGLDLPGRMVNPVLARLRLSGGCGVYH